MVNKLLTAAGEAVSSDSVYDLEDVINAAHNASVAADVVIDATLGVSMSEEHTYAALHAVKHSRIAAAAAHSAFHAFCEGLRVVKAEAPTAAPQGDATIVETVPDEHKQIIRDIRQMAKILVLLMENCERNIRSVNKELLPQLCLDELTGVSMATHQAFEISDRIDKLCEAAEVPE